MAAGALSALVVIAALGYGASRVAFGAQDPTRREVTGRAHALRAGCVASVTSERTRRAVVVSPCPRRPGAEEESRPRVQVRFVPRVVP
jgi:hypothetical protein